MKSCTRIFLPALLAAHLAIAALTTQEAGAQTAWTLTRLAASFDRSALTRPEYAQKIRTGGSLSGAKGGWGITGWVDYDILIEEKGWYQLFVRGNGNAVEFFIDPDRVNDSSAVYFFGGDGYNEAQDKIGNVWLTPGKHTIRLQHFFWTGFPDITAIEMRKSTDALAESISYSMPGSGRIFRKGECPDLEILSGERTKPARLTLSVIDANTHAGLFEQEIAIPVSREIVHQRVPLPCADEGQHWLSFGEYIDGKHHPIDNRGIKQVFYEVIDTSAPSDLTQAGPTVLQQEIDCSRQEPDYSGGGPTRVMTKPFGEYRESGDIGWTAYQRAPEIARGVLAEPSWFAYALNGLSPQQRYRIEVDYPDDAWRTFGMALRESAPLSYPVAVGVDTGGEFSLSRSIQTMAMTVWPRAAIPRLTFLTAHDGSRAACSRIRVYRAEAPKALLEKETPFFREFFNFNEEGGNFASLFGPPDGPRGQQIAVERWAESARAIGASTLIPTVVVYEFSLYPSRYNRVFSRPNEDALRRLLLVAEKYRLKVIPELHPRADELTFSSDNTKQALENLLVSKEGQTNFFGPDGKTRNFPPHYNPIFPENRDWYVAMIGELADRYKDSPALQGVSLRYMNWANPALNNFVSLDWGYDDYTVGLFKRETGSAVPLHGRDDPERFSRRHAWLTENARAAWVTWRCQKIADLLRRIQNRVRQARSDLKVYVDVFAGDEPYVPGFSTRSGRSLITRLREAGLDPYLLGNLDGIVLINASYGYGRRERDSAFLGARNTLLDPASLNAMRIPGEGGRFMSGQNYLEATDAIVPPERIGFAASTRKTWANIVANPAGRLALERYAIELAETDAVILGDGGNGYSFGPPVVREFMKTFRRLPARPFVDRADATDPVALRTLTTSDAFLFYAVNRERYPVDIDIVLVDARNLRRISDGTALLVRDGHLSLKLKPYELIGVRAEIGTRIDSVRTEVPAEEKHRVERQIATVDRASRMPPVERMLHIRASDQDFQLLRDAVAESRRAVVAGHYWHARTVLEHSDLLAVYKKLGCYPPSSLDSNSDIPDC